MRGPVSNVEDVSSPLLKVMESIATLCLLHVLMNCTLSNKKYFNNDDDYDDNYKTKQCYFLEHAQ